MKNKQASSGSNQTKSDQGGNGAKPGQIREDITVVFRADAIHPGEFEKDILHLFSPPDSGKLPALKDVCTRQEENGLITYSFVTGGMLEPEEDPGMARKELHRMMGAKILTIAKKYAAVSFDSGNASQLKM